MPAANRPDARMPRSQCWRIAVGVIDQGFNIGTGAIYPKPDRVVIADAVRYIRALATLEH